MASRSGRLVTERTKSGSAPESKTVENGFFGDTPLRRRK